MRGRQFQGASTLPCTSFRPGSPYFIHFLQGTPRLRPSFFSTEGWWIGHVGVIGFCRFLLSPSSFHFVLIKFTMASPTLSQLEPHFVPYALPNIILLELGAKIGLICLWCIILYQEVSKVLVHCPGWANQRDSCKIKF